MSGPDYPEAAVAGWQELTIRFWFEPNVDAAPENWAFEEMLGNEVRIEHIGNVELLDIDGNEVPNPETPEGTNWDKVQALKSELTRLGMQVVVWAPDDIIHLWKGEDGDGDEAYFQTGEAPTYEEAVKVLENIERSLEGAQIDRGWEVIQQLAEDALREARS